MIDLDHVTWGAEHELSDIPVDVPLPEGWGRDPEHTIVNSNGIAADPSHRMYKFGGELNTPPTDTALGQVEHLVWIKKTYPMARVNYRSNLHIHIRVSGLKDDLKALKKAQAFIHKHMRQAIEILVPLPAPDQKQYPGLQEYKGALRRWRRRKVSHRSLLPPDRLKHQLEARTVEEFFNREPPTSKAGKPLFHAQPRLCVSLRQLLQTDTVEFRHFPGTLDEGELYACCIWCERFLRYALTDGGIKPLLAWARGRKFPAFPPYIHWMEVCFRATVHDGTLPRSTIEDNIKAILEGTFHARPDNLLRKPLAITPRGGLFE